MKRKASAIMVANTAKLDRKKELAHYGCKDCGNTTIVQASMESPYCVHCGSGNLASTEQASVKGKMLLRADDRELANVKCPGCSSHLIMTLATASAHAEAEVGHINCPACATEIAFKAPESVGETDDDEWVEEQSEAESDPEDMLQLDESELDEDESEDESDEEDEADAEESASARRRRRSKVKAAAETDAESDESGEEDKPAAESEQAEEESVDDSDAAEEAGPNCSDEAASDDADGTEEEAEKPYIPATEPVALALHALTTEKASFSVAGDRLLCWQGDLVTATRAVAEGENPTALAGALTRAVETNPLAAVLAQNGFNLLTVTASADTVIRQEVERKSAEIAANVEADLQVLGERLHQSLGIATCGLNRGFFDKENPIVAALVKNLVTAGLDAEDAEQAVTEAMNEAGDEFVSVLRDLTMDIVGKHEDVRNELASTIMKVRKPKAPKATASASNPLEQALSRPLKKSPDSAETASADAPKPKTRVEALAARGSGLFTTRR